MGVFNLNVFMYTTCVFSTHGGQNRALNPLKLELQSCELTCGCWNLNLGPSLRATSTLNS